MKIVPAILTSDPVELEGLLRRVREAKRFERVQIDFVDGKFANQVTVVPTEVYPPDYPELKFDAHLMVVEKNIRQWSEEARLVGFDRIIVQMESVSRPEDFDCLALDVHSPVRAIEPYLPKLKLVNLMAIEPGFGGQEFNSEVAEKIEILSNLRHQNNYQFKICVDGGVEKNHLQMLEDLGADEVAVGARRMLSW